MSTTDDPTPLTTSAASAAVRNQALFDQYSRYASAAEAIRAASAGGPIDVLDVGSGQARLLGAFLPEARVTYLDPLLAGEEHPDVLPGTFDQLESMGRKWGWTLAVDTLEHVPAEERTRFLETMAACAERGVVVSAPFREDPAAVVVDNRVNEVYRLKNGVDYSWLEEHQTFGLPGFEETKETLGGVGLQVASFGNGHAPWLEALLPLVVCYLDRASNLDLMREISVLFNERLYRFDHFGPCYRRVLVGRFDSVPALPKQLEDHQAHRDEAAETWRQFVAEVTVLLSTHADQLTDRLQVSDEALVAEHGELAAARQKVTDLLSRCEKITSRSMEKDHQLAAAHERVTAVEAERAELQEELRLIQGSRAWRVVTTLWRLAWPLRSLTGKAGADKRGE